MSNKTRVATQGQICKLLAHVGTGELLQVPNILSFSPKLFLYYRSIFLRTQFAHQTWHAKGQLISKWFFGVVDFLQKKNRKQVDLRYHSSKVEFVRSFFGGNR